MFLKSAGDLSKTVTFRLTLWYTVLFGLLSLAVFLTVYASLAWHLRQHEDEDLLSEAKEFKAIYSEVGIWGLNTDFRREAKASGIRRVFFLLLSEKSEVLASSDLTHWGGEEAFNLRFKELPVKAPLFRTLSFPNHHHKVRALFMPTGDGKTILVGESRRDTDVIMERYRETFGVAIAVMIICGALLGWFLSRKAMAGVLRITQTATQIRQGDLSKRVPIGNEGLEIDNLARAFNEMLDRIELVMRELKEVTDNIAHDLRSPVTRMRGIAETTLTGDPSLEELKEMAASIVEESDRLIGMINTTLEITKTESGVAELNLSRLELGSIVSEAAEIFLPLAEEKGIEMKVHLLSQAVEVEGDRAKLQRVVANLLDNAIKYTPEGDRIEVHLRRKDHQVEIEVIDSGMGIPEEDRERIFERFYRGDKSRSTPGSGLGLSLALAFVKAHKGAITVESSPGNGSRFTVTLPLVQS